MRSATALDAEERGHQEQASTRRATAAATPGIAEAGSEPDLPDEQRPTARRRVRPRRSEGRGSGRLRRFPLAEGVGWSRGTDADYLADLVDYWAETYYWREHEERLLDYPWVHTERARPGCARSTSVAGADAPTVVLLHGWPDSFLRFERVLPLLTDVNVVVPCLARVPVRRHRSRRRACRRPTWRAVVEAMAELGYDRYVVSGGDIGSSVGE